jgi:hypothetical protein
MSIDSFFTATSSPSEHHVHRATTSSKGRFKVVHIEETQTDRIIDEHRQSRTTTSSPPVIIGQNRTNTMIDRNPETDMIMDKGNSFLKNLYDYQGGTFMSTNNESDELVSHLSDAQLNTLFGVYLPCVQNIIGVIVFIRLYWVVGVSGIIEGMIIIGLCCLCTFLTAISLAASKTIESMSNRIIRFSLGIDSCNQWNCSSRWLVLSHIEIVRSGCWRCRRISLLYW